MGPRVDGGRVDPLQPPAVGGTGVGGAGCRRRRWCGPPIGQHAANRADRRPADRRDQRARLARGPDGVRAARQPRSVRGGRPDGRGGRVRRGDRAEGDALDADHDAREPRGRPRRAVERFSAPVVPLGADRFAGDAHDPGARRRRATFGRGPAHQARGSRARCTRPRCVAQRDRRRLAGARDGGGGDARAARLRRCRGGASPPAALLRSADAPPVVAARPRVSLLDVCGDRARLGGQVERSGLVRGVSAGEDATRRGHVRAVRSALRGDPAAVRSTGEGSTDDSVFRPRQLPLPRGGDAGAG